MECGADGTTEYFNHCVHIAAVQLLSNMSSHLQTATFGGAMGDAQGCAAKDYFVQVFCHLFWVRARVRETKDLRNNPPHLPNRRTLQMTHNLHP